MGERLVYIERWEISDDHNSCPTNKDNLPDSERIKSGTGIVISKRKILTAFHVIEPKSKDNRSCFIVFQNKKDTSNPILPLPVKFTKNNVGRYVSKVQIANSDLAILTTNEDIILEEDCISIVDTKPDIGNRLFQLGFEGKETTVLREASFDRPQGEINNLTKSCIDTSTCQFPDSKLSGMSGGPIVTPQGNLVGIMIQSNDGGDYSTFEPLAGHRSLINQRRRCAPLLKPTLNISGMKQIDGTFVIILNLNNLPANQIPTSIQLDYVVEDLNIRATPLAGPLTVASNNKFKFITRSYALNFNEEYLINKKTIKYALLRDGSYGASTIILPISIFSPNKIIKAKLRTKLTFYNSQNEKINAAIKPTAEMIMNIESVNFIRDNSVPFMVDAITTNPRIMAVLPSLTSAMSQPKCLGEASFVSCNSNKGKLWMVLPSKKSQASMIPLTTSEILQKINEAGQLF